jgi:hypothetical protein
MTHISHGATAIAAERRRQIESEGWTPEHDDEHVWGELMDAATAYIWVARWLQNGAASRMGDKADDESANYEEVSTTPPAGWPWDRSWWKPSPDPGRNLAKAGALIAAEIDRLHRRDVAASQHDTPPPVTADIARHWRSRDWPGQQGSTPPPYYLELWRDYLGWWPPTGRHDTGAP